MLLELEAEMELLVDKEIWADSLHKPEIIICRSQRIWPGFLLGAVVVDLALLVDMECLRKTATTTASPVVAESMVVVVVAADALHGAGTGMVVVTEMLERMRMDMELAVAAVQEIPLVGLVLQEC